MKKIYVKPEAEKVVFNCQDNIMEASGLVQEPAPVNSIDGNVGEQLEMQSVNIFKN